MRCSLFACVLSLMGLSSQMRALTSTLAGPTNILTTAAVPGRSAALDVCIASPNSAVAGNDATVAAFRRKLWHYRREIPELAAAGISYRPMVWTCAGRPHPAVTRTMASRNSGGNHAEARGNGACSSPEVDFGFCLVVVWSSGITALLRSPRCTCGRRARAVASG